MNKPFNSSSGNQTNQDFEAMKELKRLEMNRKYDQILEKIQMMDNHLSLEDRRYKYSNDYLMPYLYFFKYMARRDDESKQSSRLKIWLPDTIIVNDRDLPAMWMYSSTDGYVYRTDSFTQKSIVTKFTDNYHHEDEVVGVIKKPQYRNMELVGNDVKIITAKQLSPIASGVLASRGGEITVIQRFVRCKGPKAFVCRTIWQKNGQTVSWVITNRNDYNDDSLTPEQRCIATSSRRFSCTIIACRGGRFVKETIDFVMNVSQWVKLQFGVEFQELGCDFIHSTDGKWYLINVRGFQIGKCEIPVQIRHITNYGEDNSNFQVSYSNKKRSLSFNSAKTKQCKYCEISFPAHELNYKMSLKMVLQIDHHLIHRNKNLEWIKNRIRQCHMDIAKLYHQFPVCKSCYILYRQCEQLMELEFEFARKMGIEVTEDTRYNIVSISHQDMTTKGRNVLQPVKANTILENGENYIMPEDWELQVSENTEIHILNNQPVMRNKELNCLNQYRMIILINDLYDIPEGEDFKKFHITFTWMKNTVNYLLQDGGNIQFQAKGMNLTLNRMKMFYFFSRNRDGIDQLLNEINQLQMFLFRKNEKIGLIECELNDFRSERVIKRDYHKQFSGKEIRKILSWGINISIGIIDSGETNIEQIKLEEFHGVYLPESSYYTCEPLPEEWMQMIDQCQNLKQAQKPKRIFSVSPKRKNKQIASKNNSFVCNDVSNIFEYSNLKKLNESDWLPTRNLEEQQDDVLIFISLDQLEEDDGRKTKILNILSKEIRLYETETYKLDESEYID